MSNKLRCLFLDDQRNPEHAWVHIGTGHDHYKKSLIELSGIEADRWSIVRSHYEFEQYLKYVGIPDIVSFDHDLDDEHIKHYYMVTQEIGVIEYGNFKTKTGKSCAELLVDAWNKSDKIKPLKTYVHSANRWGKIEIEKILEQLNG
jgi:hypothetical protein